MRNNDETSDFPNQNAPENSSDKRYGSERDVLDFYHRTSTELRLRSYGWPSANHASEERDDVTPFGA